MNPPHEQSSPTTRSPAEDALRSSSANGLPASESPSLEEIRALILTVAEPVIADRGSTIEGADDDLDLRASGMIDSLGFIELVAAIEDELGIELDFEDLDPDQITVLGPLTRYVRAQALAARGKDR